MVLNFEVYNILFYVHFKRLLQPLFFIKLYDVRKIRGKILWQSIRLK